MLAALDFSGNQADYPEKNSAVSRRPGRRRNESKHTHNYLAGTYVNGGELINLEFSFVLDNANSAEKLLRAYRLITGLDEISTKL